MATDPIYIRPVPANEDSRVPRESLADDQRAMFTLELSSVDAAVLTTLLDEALSAARHAHVATMGALRALPRSMEKDDPLTDVIRGKTACECPTCLIRAGTIARVFRCIVAATTTPTLPIPPGTPRNTLNLPATYPEMPHNPTKPKGQDA